MSTKRSTRHACLLAWAMLCVLLGAPTSAYAFEIKTTPTGQPLRWEGGSVTFQLDPSVNAMGPGASAAITSALRAWSSAGRGPAISSLPAAAPSQPAFDGNNVVYFAPGGCSLARAAIAITILTYDDTNGNILDSDIVINGKYAFGVLPDRSTPSSDAPEISNETAGDFAGFSAAAVGRFDIAHVVAHETGHALGMSDETVSDAPLMFLYSQPGDATHRTPTSDDLAGIGELYADAGAGGCSSSTLSPKHARPSTLAAMMVAIALGVALLRMRRAAPWKNGAAVAAAFVVVGFAPGAPRLAPPRSASSSSSSSSSRSGPSQARVTATRATETDGPWRTEMSLTIHECRAAFCANQSTFTIWGGRRGHLVQQVGDDVPPTVGDEVLVDVDENGSVRAIHPR
jgi:hypothetical protein